MQTSFDEYISNEPTYSDSRPKYDNTRYKHREYNGKPTHDRYYDEYDRNGYYGANDVNSRRHYERKQPKYRPARNKKPVGYDAKEFSGHFDRFVFYIMFLRYTQKKLFGYS